MGIEGNQIKGEGALGKSVRSALQTHSVRAPSGCAATFVCWMGGRELMPAGQQVKVKVVKNTLGTFWI